MKATVFLIFIFLLLLLNSYILATGNVSISIEPDKVIGRIDEKVYGHFFEHIYHSANGGFWGEMIWNRSFEEWSGDSKWAVIDDQLTQVVGSGYEQVMFGDESWPIMN